MATLFETLCFLDNMKIKVELQVEFVFNFFRHVLFWLLVRINLERSKTEDVILKSD